MWCGAPIAPISIRADGVRRSTMRDTGGVQSSGDGADGADGSASAQPLAGLRVVEVAQGIAGPYAGKLLADFGADVVKVEPPGGDRSRREGVRFGPRPESEESPLFLHLNTNKRSIVADPATAAGRGLLADLIATADIVLDDGVLLPPVLAAAADPEPPGRPPAPDAGLDRADLVVCSVTPYGLDGPDAGRPAAEIVTYAVGGPMLATGDPGQEPIKLAGNVVQYQTGAVAALAVVGAVLLTEAGGRGCRIEVAGVETQAASIDRRAAYAVGYQYDGRIAHREGGGRIGAIPAGIYPTDDGYCQIIFAPNWMPRVAGMLGDDDLSTRLTRPDWLDDDELPDVLNAAIFTWTVGRTKQQAMEEAQAQQLAITPLNSTTDVLADDHFRVRDFWQRWDHPVVGTYEGPGPPIRMTDGWKARRRAPLLDEHRAEILAALGEPPSAPPSPSPSPPPAAASPTASLPLDGVRVLDLTVVWAGPLCTTLLSDLGAEVIRLDNPNLFPTATRGAVVRPAPGREADLGQVWGRFPGGEAGDRPWNRVSAFVAHARNKLGATLDLRTPLGRETFLELVDESDVVVENNSIRVLPSIGLDPDTLLARNPRLVTVRMPSLGLTGPYAGYIGFGAHMEALTGLSSLRGYPDLDPTSLDPTYFMDPASGVAAAFAVLCALRRRRSTGRGETIELAQAENLMNYIGEYLVDASLTGEPHECHGNRHPHRAPQGVYPCAGNDRWVALSVADDAGWAALVEAIGSPPWACDEALGTEAGRRAAHDRIDEGLVAWTSSRSVDDVVAACGRAGVAASGVYDEADLFADAHLRARGFFRSNGSTDVPDIEFPGHLWRWDGPPLRWDPLNVMGRDNDHVFRTVLGKSDAEIDDLVTDGHWSDGYRVP